MNGNFYMPTFKKSKCIFILLLKLLLKSKANKYIWTLTQSIIETIYKLLNLNEYHSPSLPPPPILQLENEEQADVK